MRSTRLLLPFLLSLVLPAWAGDHPNDDSDESLPACAATCSVALSSAAIASGANSDNYLNTACADDGIISAFSSCYVHADCSGDDRDDASDWIHSTCRVVQQAASMTHTKDATTTTDSSSTITTTFSSSTTTASSTASTTSATATATNTPAQHHGLSGGAKAGIAVGVILGVLLLAAAIAAYCVNRMRKSRLENQAAWPLNSDPSGQMGEADGPGLGAAAAMASRYGPRDPYNGLGPLPAQPELGNSGERHELHGQHFTPWNELATGVGQAGAAPRGSVGAGGLPGSLAIAGGGLAAAGGASGARFMSELDGTSITPAALARKPVNPFRSSESWSSVGHGSRESQGELLSPVSATDATDSDRRVSSVSTGDEREPAQVPLPASPVSPTEQAGRR